MLFLWWIVGTLLIVLSYLRVYKPHQYWKEKNVPYIKPWPILGTMYGLILRTHTGPEWLQFLYNKCKNRYVGTYNFLQPTLLIKDIDLIKQLTIKDFDNFTDRLLFFSPDVEPLFGKNLFALQGKQWRNMRATLSPAFTGRKMRAMFCLISECAEQFANHFMEHTKPGVVKHVEMKSIFTKFTNDAIATCAFGIKCNSLADEQNEFYVMGRKVTNFSGLVLLKFFAYMISPTIMNFFRIRLFSKEADDFFLGLVRDTMAVREREGIIRPDLIHLLMEARKGKLKHEDEKQTGADAGFATVDESQIGRENVQLDLSDEVLSAQAIIFFVAGFDTSSTVMSFVAYELAVHEDVQRKLQKEVDEVFDKCENGVLTYETLTQMKYMDMVVSETLRLWPPAPGIDRVCVRPYTIEPQAGEAPVHLDKGDVIWVAITALHRDPTLFPEPEKFDPERFSDERKHLIQPFSYLPFGIGPRNCIGSRFALLEVKALFAHLLRKFDIVVTEKTDIPIKLSKRSLNMAAENGFHLGFRQRTK